MLSLIFELLKNVIDIISKNKEIEKHEKETMSNILFDISNIILDTSVKLSNDEYPHNNCKTMETLSKSLHLHMINYIDDESLDRLYNLLIEASNLEKLYAYRGNKETIRELMHISGEFRAMAMLIKL